MRKRLFAKGSRLGGMLVLSVLAIAVTAYIEAANEAEASGNQGSQFCEIENANGLSARIGLADDLRNGVRLLTNHQEVESGEAVIARLANFSDGYVLSGAEFHIQRYDGNGWHTDPSSPDGPWPRSARKLIPGRASGCYRYVVPEGQPAGRYRFLTSISKRTERSSGNLFKVSEFIIRSPEPKAAAEISPQSAGIGLELSPHRVSPGGYIRVRVRNDSPETITHGLSLSLQRFEDGRWVRLPEKPVLSVSFGVRPGATGRWQTIRIPTRSELGRYRIRKTASPLDSSSSEEFALYGYFAVCRYCVVPRPSLCRGATEVDYEAPIADLPPLPPVPSVGDLDIGPPRLRLIPVGGTLIVGSDRFGFELDVDRQTIHQPVSLDGYAELELDRVNRRGRVVKTVAAIREALGVVAAPGFNGRPFTVRVPAKPGLYLFTGLLRDAQGAAVGRYADYLRVLRPVTDVRLMTHKGPFGPGSLINFWIENRGTRAVDPLGREFAVEVLEGDSWSKAPSSPRAFPKPKARPLSAGASGGCTFFKVSLETPPGLYRFSKKVVLESGRKRRLTAEFEISAEAGRVTPRPRAADSAS